MIEVLRCTVNNKPVEVGIDPRESLADVLRERLGLTSVKKGCEVGECGACTVLVDGTAIAGLGRGKPHGIFWGSVLGGAARFVVHYISGITIYKILAPTEIFGTVFDNPALYSLIYNGSYVGIDLVLCLVIFGILYAPLKTYMTGADLRR